MAQFGLPISDAALGTNAAQAAGDGDGSAFDELAEGLGAGRGSGSGPDDATTYWWSGFSIDIAGGQINCNITSLTDPASSSGHIMRVRWAKATTAGALNNNGAQVDGYFTLLQSTTDKNQVIVTNPGAGSWLTTSDTLTGGEADAITDYTVLRLRTHAIKVGGGSTRGIATSAMELEIPDSGSLTPKTVPATAVGVATLSRRITFKKTLAPTAVGVVTLSRLKMFRRTLAPVAVGVSTVSRQLSLFRTLTSTAVGTATVAKKSLYYRTLEAVSEGIASLAGALTFPVLLEAVSIGIAALTTVATYRRTLASIAVGVASLNKKMFVRLVATSTGLTTMARKSFVTLVAVAEGIVSMVYGLSFSSSLSAVAVGVADIATSFITGVAAVIRRIIRYFRNRRMFTRN